MNELEAARARHSVRVYLEKSISEDVRDNLDAYIAECNQASGLHIQIFYDEPECFSSRLAHYGSFRNANNYIAIVGKKAPDLEEKAGYYGEKLVLRAQQLGLNSCWVALTHGKSKAVCAKGEKEVIIISLGYGQTQGNPHKSKAPEEVSNAKDNFPDWFKQGVEAALLAPTAMNQQKFQFILRGTLVSAKIPRIGTQLKIDLGIAKYHFELGAGKDNFSWES